MHPQYKRHRNENYLKYVRKLPSCVSGKYRDWDMDKGEGRNDPSHTWHTGKNAKRNDMTALPLTRDEHQKYAELGHDEFERVYGVDLKDEIINHLSD